MEVPDCALKSLCNLTEVCLTTWYPRALSQTCLKAFKNYDSFSLGYISSLAAVPLGRGSRGDPFDTKQQIAQAAWFLTVFAVIFGCFRKQSPRFATGDPFVWSMLGYLAKLLAITFAPIFGILNGDLNPNSNVLEIVVWLLPGLLFHRFSPELMQDNVLVGLFINTLAYIPGLVTAAFSVWLSGDMLLLAADQNWNAHHFLRSRGASLAVRILMMVAIVLAVLRQLFGAYCNLVLVCKRRRISKREPALTPHAGGQFEDVETHGAWQDYRDERKRFYNSWGLPHLAADLNKRGLVNHSILVVLEFLTFCSLGIVIVWATQVVKDASFCSGGLAPSFFTYQALACVKKSGITCSSPAFSESPFGARVYCDTTSFNVAFFTGGLAIAVSSISLMYLCYQAIVVLKRNPADVGIESESALVHEFTESHFDGVLGRRVRASYIGLAKNVFFFFTIWQIPGCGRRGCWRG